MHNRAALLPGYVGAGTTFKIVFAKLVLVSAAVAMGLKLARLRRPTSNWPSGNLVNSAKLVVLQVP
jgi:hypothetical protein